MAISRADLLKELLPGIKQLFGLEYDTQAKIDQILRNEAAKAQAALMEKHWIIAAGKLFREQQLIAHIVRSDLKKAEEEHDNRSIS